MIELKTAKEIEEMKPAGRFVGEILKELKAMTKVGTNLLEIDEYVHKKIVDRKGAESCYVDYAPDFGTGPFAHYICTSVNDAVLHGIPFDYNLKDGDLVSLDLAISVNGWVGDSAISFVVGNDPDPSDLKLIKCTEEALAAGIDAARPGNRLGDVSSTIGDIARSYGYPINLEFGGHGVGHIMHGDPHVANDGKAGHGYRLRPGLVIAIEPWFLKTTDAAFRGRGAWRPQRAHDRHHRERSGHPDHPRLTGNRSSIAHGLYRAMPSPLWHVMMSTCWSGVFGGNMHAI